MSNDMSRGLPDSVRLPHEAHHHTITPLFKHMSVLNVAQSEIQGKAVYDLKEVVELRFAGDRNYAPVFPADAQSYRIGTRVVTFAERFSDQYVAFVAGDNQRANGTALELLQDYGITPAQLSICRALKIYSIEALYNLGTNELKNLGMSANALRSMAKRYMDERTKREISTNTDSIDALKAEVDRLKALIPAEQTAPEEIDALVAESDELFEAITADELKDFIAGKTGEGRPRGNPSHETLVSMAKEFAA